MDKETKKKIGIVTVIFGVATTCFFLGYSSGWSNYERKLYKNCSNPTSTKEFVILPKCAKSTGPYAIECYGIWE